MDFDTYVPSERVRAAQVRKKDYQTVTSNGPITVPQYSYIVEHETDNGVRTEVLDVDEFNAKYKRLDWRDADRTAARDEGYNDGYDDGWNACATAKDTADKVVTSNDDTGPEPDTSDVGSNEAEPANEPLPPVGDKLETDGPVKASDNK